MDDQHHIELISRLRKEFMLDEKDISDADLLAMTRDTFAYHRIKLVMAWNDFKSSTLIKE